MHQNMMSKQISKYKSDMEVQIKDNKIYAPLKGKWLVTKPEEEVRQKYICRLVDSYGYDLNQMDQELKVTNSQRGQGAARADIVIWKSAKDKADSKNAFIVVECKAESVTIRKDDYYQGYNYASWAGADFFVTTNLKETRIFKVVKGELPKKLEEIVDIPSAENATNEKKVKDLLNQTKAFTRDEFSRLLYKCHNIIRNNDKLSPEDMVVMDLDGNRVEGDLNPSSDTPTHIELYKAFKDLGGIVHTHSPWATSWAQAGRSIPCYGTTHADYFYGEIPCARSLTKEEIEEAYEKNTGLVIIETFKDKNPVYVPGVLCTNHGPFTWGADAAEAVHNAVVLEEVAKMAYRCEHLNPEAKPAPQYLQDKHFFRKHGENAYYGNDL